MILTNSLATTSKSIRRTLRNSSDDISNKINTEINSLRQEVMDDVVSRVEELQESAQEYANTTEEHIGAIKSDVSTNNEKIESLETKVNTEIEERKEMLEKESEERTKAIEEANNAQTSKIETLEATNKDEFEAIKLEQEEMDGKTREKLGLLLEAQDKIVDAANQRGARLDSMETALEDHEARISALEDVQKQQDAEFAKKQKKKLRLAKPRLPGKPKRKPPEKAEEDEANRNKQEEEERKKAEAAPVENEWDEVEDEEQGVTKWVNKNTGEETYEKPPGV